MLSLFFFFFQAEDGIRDADVTGVQTCALPICDLLPYAYPLFRLPVESSRLVAVHNAFMARAVRDEVPDAEGIRIPLPVEPDKVRALRARYAIGEGDFVVGTFGLVTREKRIDTLARAVARVAAA